MSRSKPPPGHQDTDTAPGEESRWTLHKEVADWVKKNRKSAPEVVLVALIGNAINLAKAMGYSRERFLSGLEETWDIFEEHHNRGEGKSS